MVARRTSPHFYACLTYLPLRPLSSFPLPSRPAAAFGWPAPVAALLVALLVHGALHAAASAPAPGLPPCLRVGRALVLAALGFALRADQVFCSPLGRQTFSHWVRSASTLPCAMLVRMKRASAGDAPASSIHFFLLPLPLHLGSPVVLARIPGDCGRVPLCAARRPHAGRPAGTRHRPAPRLVWGQATGRPGVGAAGLLLHRTVGVGPGRRGVCGWQQDLLSRVLLLSLQFFLCLLASISVLRWERRTIGDSSEELSSSRSRASNCHVAGHKDSSKRRSRTDTQLASLTRGLDYWEGFAFSFRTLFETEPRKARAQHNHTKGMTRGILHPPFSLPSPPLPILYAHRSPPFLSPACSARTLRRPATWSFSLSSGPSSPRTPPARCCASARAAVACAGAGASSLCGAIMARGVASPWSRRPRALLAGMRPPARSSWRPSRQARC